MDSNMQNSAKVNPQSLNISSLSDSAIKYLLAIYELLQESPAIRAVDISQKLSVSKPSVSRIVNSLLDMHLIDKSEIGYITLNLPETAIEELQLEAKKRQAGILNTSCDTDLTEGQQKYLSTIYDLHQVSAVVHATDIANALNYSKPSVSNALKKLMESGYIISDGGNIILTQRGKQLFASVSSDESDIMNLRNSIALGEKLKAINGSIFLKECEQEIPLGQLQSTGNTGSLKQGRYLIIWDEGKDLLDTIAVILKVITDSRTYHKLYAGYEIPGHEYQLMTMLHKMAALHYVILHPVEVSAGAPTAMLSLLDQKFCSNKLIMEQVKLILYSSKAELQSKHFFLTDANNTQYLSAEKGRLGGHRQLGIYGRLSCPAAARYIAKGVYVQERLFFKDAETAISAGYRPCAICSPTEYKAWKAGIVIPVRPDDTVNQQTAPVSVKQSEASPDGNAEPMTAAVPSEQPAASQSGNAEPTAVSAPAEEPATSHPSATEPEKVAVLAERSAAPQQGNTYEDGMFVLDALAHIQIEGSTFASDGLSISQNDVLIDTVRAGHGIMKGEVINKLDYLVVNTSLNIKSRQYKKACELRNKGAALKIISFQTFCALTGAAYTESTDTEIQQQAEQVMDSLLGLLYRAAAKDPKEYGLIRKISTMTSGEIIALATERGLISDNAKSKMPEENGPYAFISYSHRDTEQAMQVIRLLQSDGYRVWFDDEIEASSEWRKSLVENIEGCEIFVMLMSEHYQQSKYCMRELHFADRKNKAMLQINLDGSALSDELQFILGGIQDLRWKKLTDKELLDKIGKIQAMQKLKH